MPAKNFTICCFVWLSLLVTACQQNLYHPEATISTITVVVQDTIHQLQLLPWEKKVKLYPHRRYYYYMGNQLASAEGGYIGRVLHGSYACFNREKQLAEKGSFAQGLKDKSWKSWYRNGVLQQDQEWRSGREHGSYLAYFPTAAVQEKGRYKKGEKQGNWYSFYENGKLKREASYRRGQLHGALEEFGPDGQQKLLAHYRKGALHGKYITFNPQGEAIDTLYYKKGIKQLRDIEKVAENKPKRHFFFFKRKASGEGSALEEESAGKSKKRFFFFKKKEREGEKAVRPSEEKEEKSGRWWPWQWFRKGKKAKEEIV